MVFSGDGNSTTIASIQIASSLDLSGFYKGLKRLDRIDLPHLELKPIVDFSQIHELNHQFDVKARHAASTNRKLKLKPTVDLSGLSRLTKQMDTIDRRLNTFTRTPRKIPLVFDTRGFDVVEKRFKDLERRSINLRTTGSSTGSASTRSSSSDGDRGDDRKLAQEIGREVARNVGKGSVGGTLKSIASAPLKLAGNAVGKVAEGITFGITQEITRNLGQGLSKTIERSVSSTFGSTELIGENIGPIISKKLGQTIDKWGIGFSSEIQGTINSILSDVQDAVKDELGSENILKAGLFTRSQQRREQQRRAIPLREQATVERRDLLRERFDVQRRADNTRNLIENIQSQREKGESLRSRIQTQVLREQMLGASPQRLAQFDATLNSLNKQLDALSKEERDLADVLGEINKELEGFEKRLEASKQVVQQVAPEQTPLAYRQAIQQVAGRKIPESQMPKLVVADAKLQEKGARAAYGIESNTLQVTSELKEALDEGRLTFDQMTDLFHELQHAMDFAFGSFEGVQARREGQILTRPVKATASELQEIAPLINLYDPKERLSEVNAEVMGRRNAQVVFAQQQRQQAADRLYERIGYGGMDARNAVNKQLESTSSQLQGIRNLSTQVGIDVSGTLQSFMDSFKQIADKTDALNTQSLQLDELEPDQIDAIESQYKSQLDALETLQKLVKRFQGEFIQRGRSVQQGQQIKTKAQAQLDAVRSVLDDVSQRSFALNVAVGNRFGEIQDAYKLLSDNLEEAFAEIGQDKSITPDKVQEIFAGTLEGIQMLQEESGKYLVQFDKRVKATQFGRGVRSAAGAVGNAAQTAGGMVAGGMRNLNEILQSPQGQALVKGLGAASKSVGMVAVGGYKLAQGLESIALDLIPMGRAIKGVTQQFVLPAATFTAATHLLPGGQAAAEGLVHLAQGAASPLAHGASEALTQQIIELIQQVVPNMFGMQQGAIGAVTPMIEAATSGAIGTAAQAGAMIVGGKVIQTAATLPIKSIAAQPQPMPMLLPGQREKEALALPASGGQISKQQKAAIEQSNKELAKKAAYSAGQTVRQTLDSATQTIDTIAKTVKSGASATSDAISQAKSIGDQFVKAYATFKEQSKKGNAQVAKAHALTILEISERSIKEIDKIIASLKVEGVDVNFAKTLGGTLQGIKGQIVRKQNLTRTYVEKNANVTPYIDTTATELESRRIQLPEINEEMIADMGVNLVGALASGIAGQHGIIAELGADLIGALVARMSYQVGRAGVKAYSGAKQDPAYEAMNALERFSKIMSEVSNELQSDFVQKEFGNQLTGDVAGFAIGNATRLAANTVDSLSGIPLKGAAAAMLTVPQIQALRRQLSQRIEIEQGGSAELESQRLDLNKLRGGKGLSEDELNQLKALNQLLEEAEKAADMAEAALGRMGKEADRAFNQSQQGLDQAIEAFESGEESASKTERALGGLGGVLDTVFKGFLAFKAVEFIAPLFTEFAQNSLNAALEFDRFNLLLEAGLGSASKAQAVYANLSAEAQDLGFNLKGAVEGYAGLAAATRGTSYEGYATEVIAEGGRAAAGAFALTEAETAGLFTAYEQILGKNRVQAEELRGQISERLPGAFQIFARSIGVTTAELDKLLQRGQVGVQEFIQFNQQLVVETSSILERSSQTTQAALNRVENATNKLQTGFGSIIQPAQTAALNAFASGLDLVANNLDQVGQVLGSGALMTFAPLLLQLSKQLGIGLTNLVFQITGLSTALKLLQSGASPQVLLQFMTQIRSLPAVLSSVLTGVKAVGSSIGLLGAKFAVAYAAITAAQVAFELFSDQSGELGDIAERSANRLDRLRDSINGVKDAANNNEGLDAGGAIGQLRDSASADPFMGDNSAVAEANRINQERLRNIPMVGGALSKGFELLTMDLSKVAYESLNQQQLDRQLQAYRESMQGITSDTQELISQTDTFISGLSSDAIKELNRLDQAIQDNQSEQRILRVEDPGNTDRLKELQEEERKLQEERGKANEELAKYQSNLQSQIDDINAAKDALKQRLDANNISQEQYNEGIKELDAQLVQVESTFEKLNDSIGGGTKRMAELAKELGRVAARLEDANEEFEVTQNEGRSRVARLQSLGANPGTVQALGDQANIQALEQKLAANQAELRRVTATLQSPEYAAILENMGITSYSELGRGTLQQKIDQYEEGSRERQVLESLKQRNEIDAGISGLQADVDQAKAQAIESVRDVNRQMTEFMRGIAQQTEDLAITLKQTRFETKIQNLQNELQMNLSGFADVFFGDMWSSINRLFEIATERSQLINDQAQRELQTQRQAQEAQRSANEAQRTAYGGTTVPFQDVIVTDAVDSSGEPGLDYVVSGGERGAQFGALAPGEVIEVRRDDRELGTGGERGYGNTVIVRTVDEATGEMVDMLYAHLDDIMVQVGQQVGVGTVLGTQGRTGSTTGAHVSVDFFGKDSNSGTAASLAMRDRIAQTLANNPDSLNQLIQSQPQPQPSGGSSQPTPVAVTNLDSLLEGGSSSPIARIVGVSEGTRTPDGGFTSAYSGHTDPGNAAHNMGSFSYQGGGASTPEEADAIWLNQLRGVLPDFVAAAQAAGLDPNDPRLLTNFLDLYTQAPLAATGSGGFLDQLSTIASQGVSDSSILEARLRSYINPATGSLDAPGFGNDPSALRADQQRRMNALNQGSASVFGGSSPSGATSTSSATVDTSGYDRAASQAQANADAQVLADRERLEATVFAKDIEREQELRRQERAEQQGLLNLEQQITQAEREQVDLALSPYSDTQAAQIVGQLTNNARGLSDANIENQQQLRDLSDSIAGLEVLIEKSEENTEIRDVLGGEEALERRRNLLVETREEYDRLKAVADGEAAARNQANQGILNNFRAQQDEQERSLTLQYEELDVQRQISHIRSPELQNIGQTRLRRFQIENQYEEQFRALNSEIVQTNELIQELQRQGLSIDSQEVVAAQEVLDGLTTRLDLLQQNKELELQITVDDRSAAIQDYLRGQQESIVQQQAGILNNRFDTFGANQLQREFAVQQQQAQYQQQMQGLEQFMLQNPDVSMNTIAQMRSNIEQANDLSLQGIRQEFTDLGDSINRVAIDGLGQLSNGLSDVILNGGKLTDLFDSVTKSILDSLLQIGTQFLQSQLYGLFFPQGGAGQRGGGGGLGGLFGTIAQGASSFAGANFGSSGIKAGGFNLGGAGGGGGGFSWGGLIQTGLSFLGGMNEGGPIASGYGGGDKWPLLGEAGEFIIRKEAVRALGGIPAMEMLNNAHKLPKFAVGGPIGTPTMPKAPSIPRSPSAPSMPQYRGESMGGGSAIDVNYRVTEINSVRYVTEDQFKDGMDQAARRGAQGGRDLAYQGMRNSPATRKGLGVN